MDYKILVKLAIIVYIITMPIVGNVPIQYYVSQPYFIAIYVVFCLIIGLVYDVVIPSLLLVVLIIWIFNKPVTAASAPQPKVYDETQVKINRIIDDKDETYNEAYIDTVEFKGYDVNKDSFATYEEF